MNKLDDGAGMMERVRRMLYNDPDAQVVANCLVMFMQVCGALLVSVSRFAMSSPLHTHLQDLSDSCLGCQGPVLIDKVSMCDSSSPHSLFADL